MLRVIKVMRSVLQVLTFVISLSSPWARTWAGLRARAWPGTRPRSGPPGSTLLLLVLLPSGTVATVSMLLLCLLVRRALLVLLRTLATVLTTVDRPGPTLAATTWPGVRPRPGGEGEGELAQQHVSSDGPDVIFLTSADADTEISTSADEYI